MNKLPHINITRTCFGSKSKQSGFSLIEVMVAAVVLSIGLLGLAGLQVVGLKGTKQSGMKLQAMSVIQNLTERMRSNTEGVLDGNYTAALDCNDPIPVCGAGDNCSAEDIATMDLHNVICGYESGAGSFTGGVETTEIGSFVNGALTVTCPGGDCSLGDISIGVSWQERAIGTEAVTADNLVINTRIAQ